MTGKGMKIFLTILGLLFVVAVTQAIGQEDDYPQEPIIFTKPVKAVVFDHKVHVEDNGMDCDSCHDDPFEMAAGTAEENKDFNMKALYQGKYCGTCHDGSSAFASNTRCTLCHIGVKGYNRMTGLKPAGGHGEHH